MTNVEWVIYWAVYLLLSASIAAGAWFCFRRTGTLSFLFLAALFILWPWFDDLTEAMRLHFLFQTLRGQKPWLFPFSLMGSDDAVRTGWEMDPGEFRAKFIAAKLILRFVLLAILFACMARSLKKLGHKQTEKNLA